MPSERVGQVVGVLGLARAAGEAGAALPGRPWVAARLERRVGWRLTRRRWLLALDDALIVDLPYGDFRCCSAATRSSCRRGSDLALQPVGDAVSVLWHDDEA
jgi:hypothetical protein